MGLRSFVAGSALVQGLTKAREALPTELFPGVEKPSVTLAHMLAAEMIQNLDIKERKEYQGTRNWYEHTYAFPSFSLIVERRDAQAKGEYTAYSPAVLKVRSVLLANGGSLTGESETRILLEAYKSFVKLHSQRAVMSAEEKRQQAALNAIEALFQKPKEVPCVELKPVEKPSKTPAGPPPSALDALLSPVSS